MPDKFDLIIRNGSVVDGTGSQPFTADVAIKDGVIVAVGTVDGDAPREIEAKGQISNSRVRRYSYTL